MENKTIETAASFSQTVQIEQYEPRSVFCSMKQECTKEEAGTVWRELYELCKQQVEREITMLRGEKIKKQTARARKVEQKDRGKSEAEMDLGQE